MAVKKRVSLRAKSTKKVVKPVSGAASLAKSERIQELIQEGIQRTDKPKRADTLRQKLERLKGAEEFAGISKSAIRRRKRKEKAQLAGAKLDDLLGALPGAPAAVPATQSEPAFVENKPKIDHTPNPHASQRGAAKVERFEREQFKSVLKNQTAASSPFASLRDAIKNRSL